ncbi:hypothetical protein BGZ65_002309 [Modicella reniformis]|uniref:Uncharacterized protein n=1 Tax=Modicella reniformis TaxID=1440133 RepID=A0A9P6ILG7_9FUNG|nr:hypothetical protein BGZ65_002309 [Modicella reniformis]
MDNAAIIENATRMYKLHAIPGEVKIVKRQGCLNEIQGVPHDDWELELPGHERLARQGQEQHGSGDEDEDKDMNEEDDNTEMRVRMKGNQDAAAQARALLAVSASAPSATTL